MSVYIIRLGSARRVEERLRIGTVRRPPRGVPRDQFASQNWYDVWYPELAPTPETVKIGQQARTSKEWGVFKKRYRAEMSAAPQKHTLELLAALSHQTNFSVGCYCEDEERCHRSVLRELLQELGAAIEG